MVCGGGSRRLDAILMLRQDQFEASDCVCVRVCVVMRKDVISRAGQHDAPREIVVNPSGRVSDTNICIPSRTAPEVRELSLQICITPIHSNGSQAASGRTIGGGGGSRGESKLECARVEVACVDRVLDTPMDNFKRAAKRSCPPAQDEYSCSVRAGVRHSKGCRAFT